MTYDEFRQNFLGDFLKLTSFRERIEYANQRLNRIGSGSGRAVYDIDGQYVLKLAKNQKGVAQNESETSVGYSEYNHHIVTKVIDSHNSDQWIISEKAKKVNEKRIIELTGIPSLYVLYEFEYDLKLQSMGRKPIFNLDYELVEQMNENEFAMDLHQFANDNAQSVGDMGRPSSYGEVMREGSPTIVLTDYGLSDEVYNTHYNPQRKKNRMYELFGFADGNDDILSDVGSAEEIRVGMWAQMPYSVSDGDGDSVINEAFVNFINNRDKYPSKPLNTMPVLADNFHDIVNNLKQVLKTVDDKERFYNNLLKLQEYLIKNNYYDRDPLGEIVTKIKKIGINEDGTALYSTINSIGQDNFPAQDDLASSTELYDNNIPTTDENPIRMDEEFLGVVGDQYGVTIEGFKNPNSIKRFGRGIKGLVDVNTGDFYCISMPSYMHVDIAKWLNRTHGINIPTSFSELYHADKFIPVERVMRTDIFGLSAMYDDANYKAMIDIEKLERSFKLAMEINPTIKFYAKTTYEIEHSYDFTSQLSEREISSMKGSSTVEVKKKCKLGGLGNTSEPCNQGDIDNLEIKQLNEKKVVSEEINASEAYSDEGAFITMVNGKRDIALIPFKQNPKIKPIAEYYGFKFIPVTQSGHDIDMNIIYRDTPKGRENAMKLHEYMKTKGGYVKDTNWKEAKYIGELLEYSRASIMEYIWRKYGSKLKTDSDYNEYMDIDEGVGDKYAEKHFNIPADDKDFEQKFKQHQLVNMRPIAAFEYNEYNVNTNQIDRNKCDVYLNPKSLTYFDSGVRALGDRDGNIYVAQIDGSFVHLEIGKALGLTHTQTYNEHVCLVRIENRNEFAWSDSTTGKYKYEPETRKRYDELMDKISKKNPQFKFHSDYYKYMGESELQQEGVGDKYAEKHFNIPADDTDFEARYNSHLIDKNKENVVYRDAEHTKYKIVKNPKSLDGFHRDVRGVIDDNGDLYLENVGVYIHDTIIGILSDLNIIKYNSDWGRDYSEYVTVQRLGTENLIVAGESNYGLIPDESRNNLNVMPYDVALNTISDYMSRAKSKNPRLNFKPILYSRSYVDQMNENILPIKEEEFSKHELLNKFLNKLHEKNSLMFNPFRYTDFIYGNIGGLSFSRSMDDSNEIVISTVLSFEKQKGNGKKMMQDIVDVADEMKIKLVLTAQPFGTDGLEKEKLINFYKGFGFVSDMSIFGGEFGTEDELLDYVLNNEDEGLDMYREPQSNSSRLNELSVGSIGKNRQTGEPLHVYKNPKSIKRMSPSIRGIIDSQTGDLYVVDYENYLHQFITDWLNKNLNLNLPTNHIEIYHSLDRLLPVQKISNSNVMGLGELFKKSSVGRSSGEEIDDINKVNEILRKCEAKNPSIKFIAMTEWDYYVKSKMDKLEMRDKNNVEVNEEHIGKIIHDVNDGEVSEESGVYKNPKSIKRMSRSIRGIIDSQTGDLFMVDRKSYLHRNITEWLNINLNTSYPTNFAQIYYNLDKLLPIQRVDNTDVLALGELFTNEDIENNLETIESIFEKCKQKNPYLEFVTQNEFDYQYFRIKKEKQSVMVENEIMSIHDLPFKDDIEQQGGKIYSVGGAVRDEFLGKESKDLDILITGIPMDKLEDILAKYGRVDAVGKSFGILKFKPTGSTEDIDIAIPRTENPTGDGGHKGFEVSSDHSLPIEKDLERRDFTINAIAKDLNGEYIDPYGGQEDLNKKSIRVVNPIAFSDDPLRMLRAVQFASRFGFTIEPNTLQMIRDNAHRISEIPAERILTEFNKIIKKGDVLLGVQWLITTGLFSEIFGFNIKQSTVDRSPFNDVKTMGEFIYLLTRLLPNSADFYRHQLKGDLDTYKEIKAYEFAGATVDLSNPAIARSIAFNMYNASPASLNSEIIPDNIKTAAQELLAGKYPKKLNELAVNGDDLMNLGLKGKEIGDTLKKMLLKVYADKVRNNKEELLATIKPNVDEGVGDTYAEKRFGIPDEKKGFERNFLAQKQASIDKPVASVLSTGYSFDSYGRLTQNKTELVPIYKNPKSLSNFDKNVRAIANDNGDLFVAIKDGGFNHGDMGDVLRISDVYFDERYLTLNRIEDENHFGFSDSVELKYDSNNENDRIQIDNILVMLEKKHPQYTFSDSHIVTNNKYLSEKKDMPTADDRIEYGCLMLYLNVNNWNKITSVINPDDLYDEAGYGIENDPHITILYGFHDEVNVDQVFEKFKENHELKPINVQVSGISIFENPEFDVVKFDVNSNELNELNSIMAEFPHTDEFPEYHPHITIAYVKKGTGKKYIKTFEKSRTLVGDELIYTFKGHKGKEGGKSLRLNQTKNLNEMESTKSVSYSAVVLNEESKNRLVSVFEPMIPDGWEIIAHHMTINLGEIDSRYEADLAKSVKLNVVDYAFDDKVFAVGVDGYPTNNKKAHITIAVDRSNGGKPMMSNNLTDWKPVIFPLKLTGVVTEVGR